MLSALFHLHFQTGSIQWHFYFRKPPEITKSQSQRRYYPIGPMQLQGGLLLHRYKFRNHSVHEHAKLLVGNLQRSLLVKKYLVRLSDDLLLPDSPPFQQ
ncbi:hypothetical protein TNCV_2235421 [Trichonephila clavipes]|nr:hypothetical protein TNCV_2235421 [Trichonephila clavipes]